MTRLPACLGLCSARAICSAGSARTVSRAGVAWTTTTTAPRRFSDRERNGFSLSVPQKISDRWKGVSIAALATA
jgi:hypothetical protein